MKLFKSFKLFLLTAVMTLGISAISMAAPQDFTFRNNSDDIVTQIYMVTSDDDSWRADVLGQDVLKPGASQHFYWDGERSAKLFDIFVKFDDGSSVKLLDMNMMKVHTIEVTNKEIIAHE